MSEVSDRYARVSAGFARRLTGMRESQLDDTSDCPDWTVRELVVHVIGTQRRVLANVRGATPVDVDPSGDLAAQWRDASAAVSAALADETAMKTVGGMFGEQSFESLVGRLVCTDTLIHTWDLARSTGQDEELDADAVEKAAAFLAPIDDAIRRPGGFASKIAPAADADPQTALLNFCGRRV